MAVPPKYSPEQKATVVALINVDGLSAADAVDRAAQGIGELEPFVMPVESARREAGRDRRARRLADREGRWLRIAEESPDQGAVEILSVCLDLLAEQAEYLNSQPPEKLDLAALGQVVKWTTEVRRGLAGSQRRDPDDKPKADDTTAALLGRLGKNGSTRKEAA